MRYYDLSLEFDDTLQEFFIGYITSPLYDDNPINRFIKKHDSSFKRSLSYQLSCIARKAVVICISHSNLIKTSKNRPLTRVDGYDKMIVFSEDELLSDEYSSVLSRLDQLSLPRKILIQRLFYEDHTPCGICKDLKISTKGLQSRVKSTFKILRGGIEKCYIPPINEEQKKRIRKLKAEGKSLRAIQKILGNSRDTIRRVLKW